MTTDLDANQVIQNASDDPNDAIRVTVVGASSGGSGPNPATPINVEVVNGLIKVPYDYIALTYVTSGNGIGQIQTAVYKIGGAGGTVVGTLTLAYDVNNNLISVTLS